MSDWEKLFDQWKDAGAEILKEEVRSLMVFLEKETDQNLMRARDKIKQYMAQLALGGITADDFAMYMRDLERLARMNAAKSRVAAKAAWQRMEAGLNNLVIGGIFRRLGL